MKFKDAQQQALSFLVEQTSFIEPQVYKIQYPDIQYPDLVPVDTSAKEWAKTITFFSQDKVGKATWFHHEAKDIAKADVTMEKFEQEIEMAGIGYGYTLEELGSAMLMSTNLSTDRAEAAKRAYEEFLDSLVLRGDATKGWTGLYNDATVTATDAPNGAGGTPQWSTKTSDEILTDINAILSGVYSASLTVEVANTIIIPVDAFNLIATKRIVDTNATVLSFLKENNVYTQLTGQPLLIRAARGLETAGSASSGRMVAYKRDPMVLKLHLPMPHKFLPVWQTGPISFEIPGIFRTGGLEIRRPGAVRYLDKIQ